MDSKDQSKLRTLLKEVLQEAQHPHLLAYSPMFHIRTPLLQMFSASAQSIHLQIIGHAKEAYRRQSLSYLRNCKRISCWSGISSVLIQSTQ
jgi:hypothetical protein